MKKYLFLLTVMLSALSTHSFAYELGSMCKTTDVWKVLAGNCDSNGRLQGKGTTTLDSLDGVKAKTTFTGNFINGFPDGVHIMTSGHWGRCRFNFSNGNIINSELLCEKVTNEGQRTTVKVRPGAGKINWDKKTVNTSTYATLKIDLPVIEISGLASADSVLGNGGSINRKGYSMTTANDVTASGQADFLKLELFETHMSIGLKISNFETTVDSSKFTMEGTFNVNCFSYKGCEISRFDKPQVQGKIDIRGLIKYIDKGIDATTGIQKYEFVFGDNGYYFMDKDNLIYFKDDKGLIFDATGTTCRNEKPGGSIIKNNKNELDIRPRCGKVITNSGSFNGEFDRAGRPLVN